MSAPKKAYTWNPHYHIRWFPSRLLDWQGFETREQAETIAKELIRANETYTIEAVVGNCEPCNQALKQILRHRATA